MRDTGKSWGYTARSGMRNTGGDPWKIHRQKDRKILDVRYKEIH
jgi:hypothetical protein